MHETSLHGQQNEEKLWRYINVRFWGNPKVFSYFVGRKKVLHGQHVVAKTDRGTDIGLINSFPYHRKTAQPPSERDRTLRLATSMDMRKYQQLQELAKIQRAKVIGLVELHKLPMTLSHISHVSWGKKMVIYYLATQRVDFRGLLRDLLKEFKTQIDLRQISNWERKQALGNPLEIYDLENLYFPKPRMRKNNIVTPLKS